jgi:hypothetical protein
MKVNQINWFGLAGGIVTIILVIASLMVAPWWQLGIGQGLGQANLSPLNFSFSLLGTPVTIPLIWFLNVACTLSLIASAIAILIYSVIPTRHFSEHLLGFAYNKPLITVIIFLASLFVVTYLAGTMFQASIPLAGSTNLTLESSEATVNVLVTTGFTWVFWLGIIATTLCIVARIYHGRIAPEQTTAPVTTAAPPAATA